MFKYTRNLQYEIISIIRKINSYKIFYKDYKTFFSLKDIRLDKGKFVKVNKKFKNIEFKDVWFTYSDEDNFILKGVNLTIASDEVVALVGKNGSGKTTIIKLLLGLLEPTKGEILVDNVPVSSLSAENRKELFSAIFQDFARYSISLRENIGLSNLDNIDDDKYMKSILETINPQANLMKNLEAGFDTRLGKEIDGGMDLSGGQWQTVAIARALFTDSSCVIMDEPTAALDPIAEAEVYKQLMRATCNRAAIFITHRLGSTRIADTIFRNETSLKLQGEVHKKSLKIPTVYHEVPKLKDIMSKAQEAFCYGPAIGATMSVVGIFSVFISLITSLMILWSFHYSLVFLVVMIALPYLLKLYINKVKFDFNIKSSPKRREADEYKKYFVSYDMVKEMKILNAKDFFLNKWLNVMNEIKKEEISINIKVIVMETIVEIVEAVFYVSSILLAIYLVVNDALNIGEFGAIIMIIGTLKNDITSFLDDFTSMHEELSFVKKGFEYMDLNEEKRPVKVSPEINSGITCKDVSFAYPFTSESVLDNINIDIKKGEVIALVGANGAGKSTFAKLLLGLLRPSTGKVMYDNKDINEIDYKEAYKNSSAVFQDFNHYYLTIGENIGLSDIKNIQDSTLILDAAKKSGAISFIDNLPEGINTQLGKPYGGIELSGGQWQQLALSRGYFRESEFIVLDEPSSALDPLKEAMMYEKFKELCTDKIGVIITHRVGAAKLADKIFLMENGKIIECGTHGELYNQGGKYHEMFTAQANMYV